MKKLANLKGVKALNKKEQQSINGGNYDQGLECDFNSCPENQHCDVFGHCVHN